MNKFLFKFAGDGKTLAEKAASFACENMKRAMVYDMAFLAQPGFPNVVLQLRPFPVCLNISSSPSGWSPPDRIAEGTALEYLTKFKEACEVNNFCSQIDPVRLAC